MTCNTMDQNKLDKLKEIGYEIKPTCGTCIHFKQFSDADFGDCQKHEYVHLKHSGGRRKLSVVRDGSCNEYERSDSLLWLHGFQELLK